MNKLLVDNISKNYGKKIALEGLSLELSNGIFGLLGPNGAGKTTLMRILTTLTPPTKGEITLGNINWNEVQKVRNIIGYLPQKFSLYKHIKVREALLHIATLKGIKYNKEKQVDELLKNVNLIEQQSKKIGQLSGGMVRRVGIAQAMLGQPKLLIVDEPTAGLDPEERVRFRKYLRQLGRDSIVIISSHIVEDIEATCEKVGILGKGKLLSFGSIEQIANFAKNVVWEIHAEDKDFYDLSEELNVISSYKQNNGYKIRFLANTPPQHAYPCTPTLEDGFLYLVKKQSHEM